MILTSYHLGAMVIDESIEGCWSETRRRHMILISIQEKSTSLVLVPSRED